MSRTTSHNYLILGDGMTEAAEVDDIREVDSTGRIGLISAGFAVRLASSYERALEGKAFG